MTERLDTLQNFFLNKISDIKAEIKNNCNQKTSRDISAANNEKVEFVQNQMIYLREEERNFKNQLRNLILDNVVKSDISKDTSYTKSNTLLTPNSDYQFPKRLLLMRTVKITIKIYTLQSHQVKHYILKTVKN